MAYPGICIHPAMSRKKNKKVSPANEEKKSRASSLVIQFVMEVRDVKMDILYKKAARNESDGFSVWQ